ncbi:Crp/Fnr family transcriptional regulator [Hymenobacter sp. ASUV-10]|uniref:Crp/Fnr family transcriptional regulator n=1 Tax=Hymenobacter aranciens TaxID=3063996 RepID=A0ABT9BE19_9BACT|nr:Crp/Fnr family transcriptional regulator [Hymenobacter sp. ASUV-10]MDO7875277.1 Crp/Fnr family transcriptional regulator [Hymenobacter sp. ASUV-10]
MNTATAADYKVFLRRFYAEVDDGALDLLLGELRPLAVRKGDFVLRAGQVQRELLFVFQGVQLTSFDHDGDEHVITFSYPPSLAGIPDSFFYQTPAQDSIRALTDSTFGSISFHRLQELFDQSQPLERLFRKMVEAKLSGLIMRHKEFHALTIKERFRRFAQRSAHLFHLVPHKYIANYLRINPTNFSKLYNSTAW